MNPIAIATVQLIVPKRLGATRLWKLSVSLLDAEPGFCQRKGALGLRPDFHQFEDRVDGHMFIRVLAYHSLRCVGKSLVHNNNTRQRKKSSRFLGTHSLVTTQLPLSDGRAIHIRKPSQPVNEQKRVCQMLGIDWESAFSSKKTETQA